ncbi:MAG: CobW family GTP-binding protein [Rhodospirillales bacterium]
MTTAAQAPAVQAPAVRLPVSVLTGFLGSGKTTLLSKLVRDPAMANTAVVINEFGEVGLDHLLVEQANEQTVLLDSGCLCCTVRGDLVDTLRDLFVKRVRGEIPAFDRVVVETTGLADPAPILHTLMSDPLLSARYRLDGVITTVDAVNGSKELDEHQESIKQAAVADRIVLTKTDIADEARIAALEARLRALNPAAPRIRASHGAIEPRSLFDAGLYNPETKGPDVVRWLREEAYRDAPDHSHCDHDHGRCDHGHDHGHGHGHDHGHDHHAHADHDHGQDHAHGHDHHDHHHNDVNRHDDRISAFCLTVDRKIDWGAFVAFMETLISLRGDDLLRVKGVLDVTGADRPVVIHGVQHLFHPPVQIEAWPGDERRSKIVFITRDIPRDLIERTFGAYMDAAEEEKAARATGG